MGTDDKTAKNETADEKPVVVRNTTDLQRLKLEKLMKNPDKPIIIPERPKGRSMPPVPDFVRNVMGSSAGAGSGEFHVYRHLRRKEYARQKFIKEKSEREKLDDEYHQKLEDNKRKADEKTAKKRAKRQKRKSKAKQVPKNKIKTENVSSESSDKSDDEVDREENKVSDNNDNEEDTTCVNDIKEEENNESKNKNDDCTNDVKIEDDIEIEENKNKLLEEREQS